MMPLPVSRLIPPLLLTLEGLAHRGYTEGFLRRHTHDSYQNYQQGFSVSDRQQFVGEFTGERRGEWAEVAVKNKFMLHDSVEIMTPQGNLNCQLDALQNARGEPTEVAPGDGHRVWLRVPEEVDLRFALLLRNFDHGEDTRDPHNRLPTETF
ncbi:putative protease [Pantoea agglomerans]|uniref:Putative protease n=1 Tax=Enterobacter agglomerans TaxID=549 RepID=A0A379ADI4_ENTAG|nr:putative protease [Pantoea agglomerans]